MIALVRVPDDLGGPTPSPRPSAISGAHAVPNGAAPGEAPPARPADADPVRDALELPRLTVTRMAAELGVPRATLEAYRLGTRRMPAAMRTRLAVYLEQHARAIQALAEVLHRS